MELNADFTRRAVVHSAGLNWVSSPMAGVERRMLDRIGGEVARATTIVRYAPGSSFSPHTHDGGEEFLVLDGVFSDEHGDYPAGSYIRNPPTSRHTPGSAPGCVLFVKLWQFDLRDRTEIRLHTAGRVFAADGPGVSALELFQDARETVRLETWTPGATIQAAPVDGAEILVLSGSFDESGEAFVAGSWLRLPPGAPLRATAGPEGCRIWIKTGHLRAPVARPPL